MALSPSKKNSGLANPRWRTYIECLKNRYWYSLRSRLDQQVKKLNEMAEEMKSKDKREVSMEENARRPRLAMEADGQANTKTRERTEGAAKSTSSEARE